MNAIARSAVAALAAIALVSARPHAAAAQTATPIPAPACARPNVPASTIHAVVPDEPPLAQQQGIAGSVQVVVSLDADSHVTAARIQSSPSAILNAPALAAARQSTYRTEIRNCRPVAGDYIYSVDFTAADPPYRIGAAASGQPTITITTQGIARPAADVAYVGAGIIVRDDDSATASSRAAAIYDALRARLRALGIGDDKVQSTFTLGALARPPVVPSPSPYGVAPGYGPYASRSITITVEPASKAGAVLDAAAAAGVTSVSGARYDLRDREAAYREAIANGLKDARARAEVIAATSHLRLGPIQTVNNSGSPNSPAYAVLPQFAQISSVRTSSPATVEVRADVTVTYLLLKP